MTSATGRYIDERAPVLIVGPCGTGKAILRRRSGHCAVRQGHDVVFASCSQLLASLNAARATGAYERKLQQLARVPVLIIDDFGLKPLRAPADEDLHDLIAERYEQAATVVTSNSTSPRWDQAFPGNRLLASATVDRLRHNAYCLTLDGASYRAPDRGRTRPKQPLPATRKQPILNPADVRQSPSRWLYMPIIGGSIVPVSDNWFCNELPEGEPGLDIRQG